MNTICKLADRKAPRPDLAGLTPGGHFRRFPLVAVVIAMLYGCAPLGIQDAYIDAVEHSASPQTRINTKVAGTPFTLDVLAGALKTDGSIVFVVSGSYFNGYSYVDLVDVNKSGGACGSINDANTVGGVTLSAPGGAWAYGGPTSGNYNWNGSEHGRLAFTFTAAQAVAKVKVRIYGYGCSGPCRSDTRCSSDSFTIRPAGFTVTTSPLSTATAVAGANISMTATAVNSSGVTSTKYTGTPTINSGLMTDWTTTAIPALSWSGIFGAAGNGVATGNSFSYKNFGQLTIPVGVLSDSTYVSSSGSGDVAGGDCVSGSSSNTLTGNKYGCNIGNTAAVSTPRFIPDHYEVSHAFTPACSTYTYLGQSLGGMTLTVNAKNSTGGDLTRLTTGAPNKPTFSVAALNGGASIAPATNPVTLTTLDWPANGSPGGIYANTSTATTRPSIVPPATPPDYETFALTTTVADADGRLITSCNGSAVSSTSCTSPTTILRYGILKLSDGLGTALIPANLQVTAQYWNGSAFVTNPADSCTTINFNANTIAPGSYTLPLTGLTLKNASTTLANGVGGLMVASTGQKTGSAAIAIKLGSTDNNCISPAASGSGAGMNALNGYLGGASCASSYAKDPSARVTFGTLKSPHIYRSEKY